MKKALVTICSREKSEKEGLLPSIERYQSERIKKVFDLSKQKGDDFFILSGEFGLLEAEERIPYYDHLLSEEEVAELVPKVAAKLQGVEVNEVMFYSKFDSKNWEPYNNLMSRSAEEAGVKLNIIGLDS